MKNSTVIATGIYSYCLSNFVNLTNIDVLFLKSILLIEKLAEIEKNLRKVLADQLGWTIFAKNKY